MSDEIRRTDRAQLRASDADRERVASELHTHAIDGRLDAEELDQRLDAAYAAKTNGELDALRRDLPPVRTPPPAKPPDRHRRSQLVRRSIQEVGGTLGAFFVAVLIWLFTGTHGFWPVWLLIPFAACIARGGWELYGPGADLDAVEARLDSRRQARRERRY